MDIRSLYREIVNEHNLHPGHKHDLPGATIILNGINPSCGDDINLQLVVKDGVIEDAAFNGSGCAISQSSADMMCDLVIGQTKEEALRLSDIFMRMIRGTASDEEKKELDEAASLEDVAHMPARVKCATLGWRTMKEIVEQLNTGEASDGIGSGSGSQACGACDLS